MVTSTPEVIRSFTFPLTGRSNEKAHHFQKVFGLFCIRPPPPFPLYHFECITSDFETLQRKRRFMTTIYTPITDQDLEKLQQIYHRACKIAEQLCQIEYDKHFTFCEDLIIDGSDFRVDFEEYSCSCCGPQIYSVHVPGELLLKTEEELENHYLFLKGEKEKKMAAEKQAEKEQQEMAKEQQEKQERDLYSRLKKKFEDNL